MKCESELKSIQLHTEIVTMITLPKIDLQIKITSISILVEIFGVCVNWQADSKIDREVEKNENTKIILKQKNNSKGLMLTENLF